MRATRKTDPVTRSRKRPAVTGRGDVFSTPFSTFPSPSRRGPADRSPGKNAPMRLSRGHAARLRAAFRREPGIAPLPHSRLARAPRPRRVLQRIEFRSGFRARRKLFDALIPAVFELYSARRSCGIVRSLCANSISAKG